MLWRVLFVCCVVRGGVLTYLDWDPEGLEAFWWKPSGCLTFESEERCSTRSLAAVQAERCGRSVVGLNAVGRRGRTNNAIIELANILALSVQEEPPLTVVFGSPGSVFDRFALFDEYDILSAAKDWACVTTNETTWLKEGEDRQVSTINASQVYYLRRQTLAGNLIRGYVLGQLMLRPAPRVRVEVEAFEQSLDAPFGYVAIHLRYLEGTCVRRMLRRGQKGLREKRTNEEDAETICHMPEAYVRRQLKEAHVDHLPVVLAHDHERPDLATHLQRALNAKSYDGDPDLGEAVDAQLLLRAQFVITNPASTLSTNVIDVRCALSKTHAPNSNMICRNSEPSGA